MKNGVTTRKEKTKMMNKKTFYLDNSATIPLLPEVKEEIIKTFEVYGNPSSLYTIGQESKQLIEDSRRKIANLINCNPQELYFTSGGSEADNWALIGVFDYAQQHNLGKHIIVGITEHHAIINTAKYLHDFRGADITYVGVDKTGRINLDELEKAIRPDTILISVMYVNNEVGTINDINQIAEIAHNHGILYHCDAVQALGHITIDLSMYDVDLMSFSGHKIGAPKGIGCLYVKDGLDIPSYIHGGGQEQGRRASTENILGIVGFGKAAEMYDKYMYDWYEKVCELSVYMNERILNSIPDSHLNGDPATLRMWNILNFSFDNIKGEELLTLLELYGICISTGSACNSSSGEPSHVLLALGCTENQANSSIRISISHQNTVEEIDFAVDRIKECVERLRNR